MTVSQIADIHRRTPGIISYKIKDLGIISKYSLSRGYLEYKNSKLYKEIVSSKILSNILSSKFISNINDKQTDKQLLYKIKYL